MDILDVMEAYMPFLDDIKANADAGCELALTAKNALLLAVNDASGGCILLAMLALKEWKAK